MKRGYQLRISKYIDNMDQQELVTILHEIDLDEAIVNPIDSKKE